MKFKPITYFNVDSYFTTSLEWECWSLIKKTKFYDGFNINQNFYFFKNNIYTADFIKNIFITMKLYAIF